MRWKRPGVLPADARAGLGLHDRERVLAAARLPDGLWAAATPAALLLPGRRLEWLSIGYAGWDNESATLRVDELRTGAPEPQSHRLVLEEPGLLPEVVRDRVTASIVASRHFPVEGRAGVRVVARRAPGQDELVWQVVVDRGLDPCDARVAGAGETGIAEMRRELEL